MARLLLSKGQGLMPSSGRQTMTNFKSIAGAACWAMVSVTLAFSALAPVHFA